MYMYIYIYIGCSAIVKSLAIMRALLVCCVLVGLLYPALAKQDEQGMAMGRHRPPGGRPGRPGPPPTNMTGGEMLPSPAFCVILNMVQELNMTLSNELTAVLELCPTNMEDMVMRRHRRPVRPSSNTTEGEMPSPMCCFILNLFQEYNMTLSVEQTAALELCPTDMEGMAMGRRRPHGGRPGRPGPPPTNMTGGEMLPPLEFCFYLIIMQELNMTLSDNQTAALEECPTVMEVTMIGRRRPIPHHGSPPPFFTGPPPSGPPPPMMGRRRPIPHHGSPPPGFTGSPSSDPPPPMMGMRRPMPHHGSPPPGYTGSPPSSPLPSKRPWHIQPRQ